ncbi:N-acyl homoserine lactonase family protein [Bacillus thuringiensis]|uniref:N-acyl homoserine lactonase family protein n=1 Tax=Bacillus thuringiensis TaxID=1428 RepID=UPI002FFF4B4A
MSTKKVKLYVLDHGKLMIDINIFNRSRKIEQVNDFMEIPVYTILIDHPDGKILFDASCHPHRKIDLVKGGFPNSAYNIKESDYLINRLGYLGILPEDIRYVVVSHLHFDHAGCLEMFPNSQIIVHEAELFHTLKNFKAKNLPLGYIESDISVWLRMNLDWKTVQRSEKKVVLVEGVEILNFGSGHTWGMLGMRINLKNKGTIILTSDAIYSKEHYTSPIQLPSQDAIYNLNGYMETIREIKNYERENRGHVWFGHDSTQFQSLIKSTEGFYD